MFASEAGSEEREVRERVENCREPEHRLMLAVLEEALATFRRGLLSRRPMARKAFFDVDAWVRDRDFDWPFSFENICATLEIDADYVRAGLAELKRKTLTTLCETSHYRLRRERLYDRRGWRGKIG
jgi:hypothetical protein